MSHEGVQDCRGEGMSRKWFHANGTALAKATGRLLIAFDNVRSSSPSCMTPSPLPHLTFLLPPKKPVPETATVEKKSERVYKRAREKISGTASDTRQRLQCALPLALMGLDQYFFYALLVDLRVLSQLSHSETGAHDLLLSWNCSWKSRGRCTEPALESLVS